MVGIPCQRAASHPGPGDFESTAAHRRQLAGMRWRSRAVVQAGQTRRGNTDRHLAAVASAGKLIFAVPNGTTRSGVRLEGSHSKPSPARKLHADEELEALMSRVVPMT